jgi:hypothetical protein
MGAATVGADARALSVRAMRRVRGLGGAVLEPPPELLQSFEETTGYEVPLDG